MALNVVQHIEHDATTKLDMCFWLKEVLAHAEIVMESSFVGAVCPLVLRLPMFFFAV